ncbi:AraC-like DNA-binding protein [Bacillus sp. SLBN-46]|uniref:DinB family protein n=1 Tax=Bacillus sp. SLBN-46 TaxID=3042283 RepID=UPI00285AE9B0|nr:DinB family protein [Bacillus sp. SLBN-46]MDR6123722.1 AraC-like DNA-binding protein [Bacillus sp. SLBN-46]
MSNIHIENLSDTRNRLLNEISLLGYDEFNKSPNPTMWSMAQVSHHLALTEKSFTRAIEYGLKQIPNNQVKRKNLHHALDRTKKIEAPEIVKPNLEPIDVLEVIDLLNDSRNYLLTVLKTVKDKSILEEKSVLHPVFGELLLDQWVELIYLHEQRHIDQIKEIKYLLGLNKNS